MSNKTNETNVVVVDGKPFAETVQVLEGPAPMQIEMPAEEPKEDLPTNYVYRVMQGETRIDSFLWREKANARAQKAEGLKVEKYTFQGHLSGISQKIRFPAGKDEGGEVKFATVTRKIVQVQRKRGKITGIATFKGETYNVEQTNWEKPWEVVAAS